jgi:hypothetical protein
MNGLSIRPSRLWYMAAGFLLAVVAVGAVLAVSGFSAFANEVTSFQRVAVPGQRVLTFSSSGSYLVYFEGPGFSQLHTTATVQVGIHSEGEQQQIKLSDMNGLSETYNIRGHSGLAVASFTITTPGRYLLTAGQPNGSPIPVDIAVGPGIVHNVVIGAVGIIAGVLALIGSVVAWLITFLLRGRSRRRMLVGPVGPLSAAPFGMQFPGAAAQQPPYGQYQWPSAPPAQYPGPAAPPPPGSQPPFS